MALLRIPDPNEPPNDFGLNADSRMEILLITVNALIKKVDELEERIRKLERR